MYYSTLALAFLATPLSVFASPIVEVTRRQAANSIDAAMKAKGKLYWGTATDQNRLMSENDSAIIQGKFGQLTPENSMKWDTTESISGVFNFDHAQYLVDWATKNKKLIRGHTLVWHSQLPSWVSALSAEAMETAIKNHIVIEMTKWKGQIYAWDVVNEVLDSRGALREGTPFMHAMGERFVRVAFETARETDPDVKLYINEYNLDNAGDAKTLGMRALVQKWIGEGIPIDGIGSQSHLEAGQGAGVAAALEVLAKSGVSELAITELDIVGGSAADYVAVTKACVEQSKCVGITTWGISDRDSWRAATTPLLFDEAYNAKDSYNAVYKYLTT